MRLPIWVCLIYGAPTYSHEAVQIRVGLELADNVSGCSIQEVSEYGSVYGSSGESPILGGFPVDNPTKKTTASKTSLREISLSEYGSEGFRVRLKRLSEYGFCCLLS